MLANHHTVHRHHPACWMLSRRLIKTAGRNNSSRITRIADSSRDVDTVTQELSVEIPTAEARSCIRFTAVPTGPAQQAIVVEAVADGSSAAQSGVQRGMKLTAISDPVRRDEVWELQDRPSIRYIRDVVRMRSSNFIEMRFVRPTAELMAAMEAADDALQLTANCSASVSDSSSIVDTSSVAETAESISALTSLNSTDESSGSTMAERMAQQFEQKQNASQGVVAFKQRQQKRKEYMEQTGQRSNNTIVLILGASFLLPALVILAVAYGSGYLDALYSNTMSNMR